MTTTQSPRFIWTIAAVLGICRAASAQDLPRLPTDLPQTSTAATTAVTDAATTAATSNSGTGANGGSSDEERNVSFRAGGDVGYASLEGDSFLAVNAEALLRVWNFRFDLAAPLRFNLSQGFSLRARDWDETRDLARVPRCLRLDLGDYDRPSDRFDATCGAYKHTGPQFDRLYFSSRIAPLSNITLGHGTLVNSFRNSFDPDHPALGVNTEFELWDWIKVNHIVDDISRPRVTGGRISFWPIQMLSGHNREWSWDRRPDELELGFTAVADINAPLTVQSALGRPIVDSQANLQYNGRTIGAVAADIHYYYLAGQSEQPSSWKYGVYGAVDYVRFVGIDDMDMINSAFRFVALNKEQGWDIRIGGDYRNIGNRFVPGYFDANYSVNSQQFALTGVTQTMLRDAALTTTKLQYALSRAAGRAHGFRLSASVQIPIPLSSTRWTPMPVTFYFEDSQLPADATLMFGVGPFQVDQLTAGAQFVRRNFSGIEDLFSLDGTLVRVFGQLFLGPQDHRRDTNILSKLFLNVRYDRRWNLLSDGVFAVTNDFQAGLGFAAGLN